MRTNETVRAVVVREGKLLLIHRFKYGDEYWVVPGGGVEEGESLEVALEREVGEETGLRILKKELTWEEDNNGLHHYFYRCDLSEGEPVMGGPEQKESSEDNRYSPEWVELVKIRNLEKVYPPDLAEMIDIL